MLSWRVVVVLSWRVVVIPSFHVVVVLTLRVVIVLILRVVVLPLWRVVVSGWHLVFLLVIITLAFVLLAVLVAVPKKYAHERRLVVELDPGCSDVTWRETQLLHSAVRVLQ